MWLKQMTVADWLRMFEEQPAAISQIDYIEDREQRGRSLATWEHNCLKAYRQRQQSAAA